MTNEPQLLSVAEGVYAWIGAGGDSNAGAIDTPTGMLAVDAQQYPRLARQFRTALDTASGKPVRELINTHCHLDHTAGNGVFADVPILAHEKTLAAMHAALGPKTGEHWTITDYATKIRLLFDALKPRFVFLELLLLLHIAAQQSNLFNQLDQQSGRGAVRLRQR